MMECGGCSLLADPLVEPLASGTSGASTSPWSFEVPANSGRGWDDDEDDWEDDEDDWEDDWDDEDDEDDQGDED